MNKELKVNLEELVKVYSESIPSIIRNLHHSTPKQGSKVIVIKNEMDRIMDQIDKMLRKLLFSQLCSLGLSTEMTIEDFKRKAGLNPLFDRWLEASINFLAESKYIEIDNKANVIKPNGCLEPEDVWQEWDEKKNLWLENSNVKANVVLVETTMRFLPQILTGRKHATDVIFPNSSVDLVQGIYKGNLIVDHFNETLSEVIVSYIEERIKHNPASKIRIIEIGAGTGGTSSAVLKRLKPYAENIAEYCYTDISKAFLIHAEKNFKPEYNFLTHKLLNIEVPVSEQNIDHNGEYDIAVAANVLHATKNIRQTLRNAKAVLKKNGLLVLNELSSFTLFNHLIFGLLEGWWLYEDQELRIQGCPALSSQSWQKVLKGEGFKEVYFPEKESHELGQQIIVAESDGVVRQMKGADSNSTSVVKKPKKWAHLPQNTKPQMGAAKSGGGITEQMIENYIKEAIIEKLSQSLKVDSAVIEENEAFSDYGLDSITGVHVIQEINQVLNTELQTTDIFDHSTVNQLAQYIMLNYKDGIANSLDKSVPDEVQTVLRTDTGVVQGVQVTDKMVSDHIKETIVDKLSQSLKVDLNLIDCDEAFSDYGLDSITGVHVIQEINQELNIELQTTDIFDYSTVNQLTEYILSNHKEAIAALLGKSVGHPEMNRLPVQKPQSVGDSKSTKRYLKQEVRQENAPVKDKSEECDGEREPIAIIGMSGRFAKSHSLDELWNHLANGDDLVEKVSRWDFSKYYPGKSEYCSSGSFLDNYDQFDPYFFNISTIEATYMDPQQRIFLEESWSALEDAGYAGGNVGGRRCGVYVGTIVGDYQTLFDDNPPAQSFWGNSSSVVPARIAYYLDLHGPAVAVDTACSSSLVATHLACQGLWSNEIEMAIAGGVFVQATPGFYLLSERAGMLSKTGHCYTFDERADGFVPGEGAGVIILKRLKEALADGDHIYGVIKGSAMNQDGATNGITAPSANSQERLEQFVYDNFKIHPDQIQMVEAHGTGTKLGDPIEYGAITRAFRKYTHKEGYCAIGSIKTNIGHTAAAAGVASLIKVLLSIKYKKIPPSLYYELGNSNIQFEGSPFYVNTQLRDWKVEDGKKRCGAVSSFGFSGTNVHMVLEEAPQEVRASEEKPGYLLVLSAKTQQQLREQAEQLVQFCHANPDVDCGNMSYTLLVGRKHLNHRLACVVRNSGEIITLLNKWLEKGNVAQVLTAEFNEKEHLEQVGLKRYGNKCIQDCRNTRNATEYLELTATIADLFIQGYALDYQELFEKGRYSRMSLPTYPFARERFWVDETKTSTKKSNMDLAETYNLYIHPMLQKNTSDISENRYSSVFTGKEIFAIKQRRTGDSLVPGVACLEMARAAVEEFIGLNKEERGIVTLRDVLWNQPIVVGTNPLCINIALILKGKGEADFEIYNEKEGNYASSIYAQGKASFNRSGKASLIDIGEMLKEFNYNLAPENNIYELLKLKGVEYTEQYQTIENVYMGTDKMLLKLSMPIMTQNPMEQLVLNPGILEAVLQATMGFKMNPDGTDMQTRIISLKELQVYKACTKSMWARISYDDKSKISASEQTIDVDLYDDTGEMCLQIKGFKIALTHETDSRETVESAMETASTIEQTDESDLYDEGILRAHSIEHLKKIMAEVTKIPSNRLDLNAHFEELGLDSIMITELNNKTEQWIGKSDATLFFKYTNIQSLANYLVETYPEKISEMVKKTSTPALKEKTQIKTNVKTASVLTSIRTGKGNNEKDHIRRSAIENADIAIIGVSGRYPEADTLEKLWNNLKEGRDCIRDIPTSRWPMEGFFEADRSKAAMNGLSYTKWGGFLEDVDCFDPLFFNISPRDAMFMDPQERLFLQTAWHCLEDAGYTRDALKMEGYGNKIGVFVGATYNNYQLFMAEAALQAKQKMYVANSWIYSIANRVSFIMNFTGPSLTIDTACSSSLYAVHLACESIRNGQSSMAIAGGVNLSLHPSKYITLSAGQFAADDGRCRAFCEGGTGYVPAEAVGAVFLKPLHQAEKDGDRIYGVIKGTGVSHAGKTNGFTVPSPVGQSLAIETALMQSNINPRSISCVEAHGTGTSLGDPIEITGLADVFKKYTKDRGFCSISSIKSNIGHAEAAAGMAQLAKVILQLKHKTLVQNLTLGKDLNPNIDFDSTPFKVQVKTEAWNRPVIDGREVPRRAGISSFGAGGANAHIIVEEYIKDKQRVTMEVSVSSPAMVILSGRDENRLKEYAAQLLAVINEGGISKDQLDDMAYTLQIGREAMEARLGILAFNLEDLAEKLKAYLEERKDIEGIFLGQVKKGKGSYLSSVPEYDADTVEEMIKSRKYKQLLELWTKGFHFDWNRIYGDKKPERISLPTYPFAKERYWVPQETEQKTEQASGSVNWLHPLLHTNTSNLAEQRFSSTFTGSEYFLADCTVNGTKAMPGIVFLEMARAALEASSKGLETPGVFSIKNLVFEDTLLMSGNALVHIGLFLDDNENISFEIYNDNGNEVYCRGMAVLMDVAPSRILDLNGEIAKCGGSFPVSQCYHASEAFGVKYDIGYQGLVEVYIGQNRAAARLSLPASSAGKEDGFFLNPGILVSALQAAAPLIERNGQSPVNLTFPDELREIEIMGECTPSMWAFVSIADDVSGNVVLDIDLCDMQGKVCVRMKGLEFMQSTLGADVDSNKAEAAPEEAYEMLTFEETWQEEALTEFLQTDIKTLVVFVSKTENQKAVLEEIRTASSGTQAIFIQHSDGYRKNGEENYNVDTNDPDTYKEALVSIQKTVGEIDAILYMWTLEDSSIVENYLPIISILSSVSNAKLKVKRILLAGQFENTLERCYLESWIGFERSLGLVMPNTQLAAIYQTAQQEAGVSGIKSMFGRLMIELQAKKLEGVLYKNEKRHVYRIQPTSLKDGSVSFKVGATYLITGGCGGLGLIFARHMAKAQPINLILTGRSPLDDWKQSKINEISAMGSQVMYIQADVCDLPAMKAGLEDARKRFGPITGIIHAAGVEEYQLVFEKDYTSFQRVLAPKIEGALLIDKLLIDESPDFICYFSSSAAILGDFGSCDYAIANRFLMTYADYRNTRKKGVGSGKAFVINWPLWKDGGMSVGDNNTKMYLKSSGQRFLELEEGLEMFDRVLAQDRYQHLVFVGQPARVKRFLGLEKIEQSPARTTVVVSSPSGKGRRAEMKGMNLEQCIEWDLKELIGKVLRMSKDRLDREINLADFGFDSISLTELATVLTNHYGIEVTPAIFYGYSTIEKLVEYFVKEKNETVVAFYQEETTITVTKERAESTLQNNEALAKRQKSARIRKTIYAEAQGVPEPIAIIGMSGRFPDARNIDEMWTILEEGREVIKEPPEDRFANRAEVNPKWRCGFVPGVSEFDPLFFEISPREATTMDPRQRLLLQEAWNALEDAGYGSKQINKGRIGMFVGAETGDYQFITGMDAPITSNHPGVLSGRLSYFLNLSGPNMAINTACSSGLVAAHQACLSLRNVECETAIVAGVNLMLAAETFEMVTQAGMLSPDGKCFAFDKRASGMVPGEAIVAVVLKRLSQAEADGDPIYAIIRGSGINYDGKTNGITAPSSIAQADLLKLVYERSKLNPEDIEYIITHGTGTKLGDPVEINALNNIFKDYTKKQAFCALTSTKTNFGHSFAASGLLSLTALVQSLRHETIPASLNCEQENDYIEWEQSPFYVNKANRPWLEKNGKKRMGAISAFGMSGTNAHMVVQSYKNKEAGSQTLELPFYMIAFSAKTPVALEEKARDIIALLEGKKYEDYTLADISYTLLEGRQHFSHRCAIVAKNREDAAMMLRKMLEKEKLPNQFSGKVPRDFSGRKVIQTYTQDLIKQSFDERHNNSKYQDILCTLAEFYCQGYDISWSELFNSRAKRLHLPTYPFARSKYWKGQNGSVNEPSPAVQTNREKSLITERWDVDNKADVKSIPKSNSVKAQAVAKPLVKKTVAKPENIILKSVLGRFDGAGSLGVRPKPVINLKDLKTVRDTAEPINQSERSNEPKTAIQTEVLQKGLISTLAQVLSMNPEDIDVDTAFINMGLDSITGVEWVNAIDRLYGYSIESSMIYEYPNIRQLALFIEKNLNKNGFAHGASLESMVPIQEETNEPDADTSRHTHDALEARENSSLEGLEAELKATLAEALSMSYSDIESDCKFIDMGLDSIIGVEWTQTINKRYGMEIPATTIYDYPSIKELAAFLSNEIGKSSPVTPVDILSRKEPVAIPPIPQVETDHSSIESVIDFGAKTEKSAAVSWGASMESLEEELVVSLAEVLAMNCNDLDLDAKFIDIGMDSIISVEWVDTINKKYGTSVEAATIYHYPSIREFAKFLVKEMAESVTAQSNEEAAPSLSIRELIQNVHEGTMDIEQTDEIINQLFKENQ